LNTDLAIVKTFEFDENTGEVTDTCRTDSRTCENNADTESIVAEYVSDGVKLADDFAAVYYKLLRKGYADGDISEINGAGKCILNVGVVLSMVLGYFLSQ